MSGATYSELIDQIEDLQKQADKKRKEEFTAIVKTIRKQIADYGITAEDLGLQSKPAQKPGRPRKAGKSLSKSSRPRATKGQKVAPKFKDGLGNTWSGRGKLPKWLASAVAQGQSIEQYRIA